MCGRYASTQSDADLVLAYEIDELFDDPPPPSWNVAPTDPVRIIAQRKPPGHTDDPDAALQIQLRTARWGLIPSWSRTRQARASMINARFETVTTKPAFKSSRGPPSRADPGTRLLRMADHGDGQDPALPPPSRRPAGRLRRTLRDLA